MNPGCGWPVCWSVSRLSDNTIVNEKLEFGRKKPFSFVGLRTSDEEKISHPQWYCKNFTEVASKWGGWLHRLVRCCVWQRTKVVMRVRINYTASVHERYAADPESRKKAKNTEDASLDRFHAEQGEKDWARLERAR